MPDHRRLALTWIVLGAAACTTTAPATSGDDDDGTSPDADVAAGDAANDGGGAGSDGAAGPPCTGASLCQDFEATAPGAVPGGAWRVVTPSCSGTGSLAVTAATAHGGAHALEVRGAGGYCNHVFLAADLPAQLGPTVHLRFFVRLADALGDGHTTFVTLRDQAAGKDLRLGGQSRILMWNRELDDATLPELSPTGIGLSVMPPTGRWLCVEAAIDRTAGTLRTSVDGAPVAGLVVDATPTPDVDGQWLRNGAWRPALVDLKLGWESYAGQAMTLWFDDIAVAATPIGCP